MQQLKSGVTLQNGKYKIEKILGQGGFGITYLAENVAFEEQVCIKEFFMKGVSERDANATTISISNADSRETFEEQRNKFKKGARRLYSLHNEHIVRVLDLFDENHTTYYVMELIRGENLAEVMTRIGQPLKEAVALDYFRQVLDALQTAHCQKIWHLDIKPANIMVDTHHHVKLIDFGASKQIDVEGGYTTIPTAMCYTKGYAPVEQLAQDYRMLGPWTDFYALGATLYTLLTNQLPPLSSAIDDDSTVDKHIAFAWSGLVSSPTQKVVIRLMATSRLRRPQNAEEIKSLLQQKMEGEETQIESYRNTEQAAAKEDTVIQSETRQKNIQQINGHDYMDLGLSVKWATMNVGASRPEGYGEYFAWGETQPKNSYEWSTYKYGHKREKLIKYVNDSHFGKLWFSDGEARLELHDDVAHTNWGGGWRMPSFEEIEELLMKCFWKWTSVNGVNGCKVTSKINGNSIFLPAAGCYGGGILYNLGIRGNYWSTSLVEYDNDNGCSLYFDDGEHDTCFDYDRYYGQSVRPVVE